MVVTGPGRWGVQYNSFFRVPYGTQRYGSQLDPRNEIAHDHRVEDADAKPGVGRRPDRRGVPCREPAAWLSMVVKPQIREGATTAGCSRAPLRALRNFVETFPLFAAVVLAAHVSETHNVFTEWGARLYFWTRLA